MIHWETVEITKSNLAYICLGGFCVAFSMFSLLVKEKFYINEVVLGTAFGVLMGPHVANIFNPHSWGDEPDITLEVMRIVLATGLFAIGVDLPKSYMRKHAKGLLAMVVPTMAIGWVVVSAVIKGLFPRLNFVSCLAIAACLTPTDPIISAAIVGGKYAIKHVPLNLRQILSAESAANDGLAYPFLTICLFLIQQSTTGAAVAEWFVIGWLYQVFLGTALGGIIGIIFSKVLRVSNERGFIDRESYVAQYLALVFLTMGLANAIGSDDLLAAFACGSAISWDGKFNVQVEGEVFSSVIELVLNSASFVYIGAWLPFDDFHNDGLGLVPWKLVVLVVAILFLRRIPVILMLHKWIPEIRDWKEALFSGHFGPMGVGAIFISTLAFHQLPEPHDPPESQAELLAACIRPIVAFVVLSSIIIHGLSIPFFSFGRNMSRTVSVSNTLTTISQAAAAPEWMQWITRADEVGRDGGVTSSVQIQTPATTTRASSALSIRSTPQDPSGAARPSQGNGTKGPVNDGHPSNVPEISSAQGAVNGTGATSSEARTKTVRFPEEGEAE